MKKVISVFKTHVDVGFTDLPHKVLSNYSHRMLKDVIETCEATSNAEKNKKFVWTMPAFVLLYSLENTTPDLRKRAENLIENEQIVWHALPFTLRTEFFSKFELSHALDYAKELCLRYNKPMPVSAKMTDVPGHTQALIDVLSENNVKFLHLGCNDASFCPEVPRLFHWVSKNNNSIVVYYDKDYGSSVIPPNDWEFPVSLAMTVSRDNCGIQSPDIIKKQIEALNNEYEYTTGTMDDFWKEFSKYDLSNLPIIKGELGDTWIHSLGAFPEACEAIYPVKGCFEKISDFLDSQNDFSFNKMRRKYFDNLFLFGEHSGGVSSQTYIASNRKYDKTEFLKAVEGNQLQYANSGWDDERRWAFSARDAVIELKAKVEEKYNISFDEKNNKNNPEWEVEVENKNLKLIHKSGKVLTVNYEYNIIGYERIEEYIDKYLRIKPFWAYCDFGRYYQDPENPENPDKAINTYPYIPDMTFRAKVKKVSKDKHSISVTYALEKESYEKYGNCKRLEITATVIGKKVHITVEISEKQPTMYVESGNIIFTLDEDIYSSRINKSGIEINPETDIVSGANSVLFAIDKYVKINDLKITSINTPLVAFGKDPVYRFNAGKFEMPKTSSVLFNVFNNMWGTGAPQWISGSYKFE